MSAKVAIPYQAWAYLSEMFNHGKVMSALLWLRLFPNLKELTESMAAYNAVRQHGPFALSDPEVTLISVGDGNTPRTAALFALRSGWQCWSIDPRLRGRWPVERLTTFSKRVEEMEPQHFSKLVIAAVHSHAKLEEAVGRFTGDMRFVVAIPCCVSQRRERPPDMEYEDEGCVSPQRKVLIWKDLIGN